MDAKQGTIEEPSQIDESYTILSQLIDKIRQHKLSIKEFDLLDSSIFAFIQEQSVQTEKPGDVLKQYLHVEDNRFAFSSGALTPLFVNTIEVHILVLKRLLRNSTHNQHLNPSFWKRNGANANDWLDMYQHGLEIIEQKQYNPSKQEQIIQRLSKVEKWTIKEISQLQTYLQQEKMSRIFKKEVMTLVKWIETMVNLGRHDDVYNMIQQYCGNINFEDAAFWDKYLHILLIRLLLSPKSMLQPPHLNLFQDIILLYTSWTLKNNAGDTCHLLRQSLRYLGLICLKHRKCASSWHARHKILKVWAHVVEMQKSDKNQGIDQQHQETLEDEIRFCAKCNKYEERNYYNWWYRSQLMARNNQVSIIDKICNEEQKQELANLDSDLLDEWLKIRPKDPSAHWYKDNNIEKKD